MRRPCCWPVWCWWVSCCGERVWLGGGVGTGARVGGCGRARAPKVSITSFVAPVSHPLRIAAGPDGALWFTNAATTRSGGSPPAARSRASGTRHRQAAGDHGGPDGALWFTNAGNDSIGRITTGGKVTHYRHASISGPQGIAAGPDGALWFTNRQRLDRADHHRRQGHQLQAREHQRPAGDRAGPDGALWFTNDGGNSIGRITTGGIVTQLQAREHQRPAGDHCRAGRRPLVHQLPGQLDRADHDRRHRHQLQAREHQRPAGDHAGPDGALWFTNFRNGSIGRITTGGTVTHFKYANASIRGPQGIAAGPDGALWFTNEGNDSIGRITTAGTITNYMPAGISYPTGSPPGRTAPSGSPTRATTRSGGSPPAATITNYRHASIAARGDRGRAGRRPLVHQLTPAAPATAQRRRELDRADHHQRHRHELHARGHPRPVRDRRRAGRRPLVHQLPGQLDRADHHRRHGHQLQAREHPRPAGDRAGPDGALWFTNRDSIGRITTGGTVTSYSDASISGPWGIAAGPDGALWFTNYRGNSIGRITTSGTVTELQAREHQRPAGDRGGPGRRPLVHQQPRQLDRADHHRRQGQQLQAREHRQAVGDHHGPGRRPLVHERRQQLDRARGDPDAPLTESTTGPCWQLTAR